MTSFLTIGLVAVSVFLIILVLLQERSSGGVSNVFGGAGGEAGFYQKRRGFEKIVFVLTIIFLIVFAGLSLAILVL
ncbi:MAG: preprotein translocase subunit SecG [Candidatus Colwellbacteria bacterium RIFCSPHIGHO2_12_FULL_44_17]|uniref:Protein-export membrane protein SecG n=1 Tax=Candidatus Colwellbacteria bacterium RIFCSPHIGHO2_12_FULL_44_17 TaxID=1797689 RepID=A0A1G1Z2C9_9BACT|nr:MAG: preprotein translocase subunit SecG [Candidatus Colwellbacteria bacterium RIFCSPHIGHO2_12_FULL_44_17]